jgi:hypothetical protein
MKKKGVTMLVEAISSSDSAYATLLAISVILFLVGCMGFFFILCVGAVRNSQPLMCLPLVVGCILFGFGIKLFYVFVWGGDLFGYFSGWNEMPGGLTCFGVLVSFVITALVLFVAGLILSPIFAAIAAVINFFR